jgi:probable phosphomutase (TIGR03848 family)
VTTFLLLRHGHSTANGGGILAGRSDGVLLSERGEEEARALATILVNSDIKTIYSSPLERCLSTVSPLAKTLRKRVKHLPGMIEMDYGLWSGRKLTSLVREPLWKKIQNKPDSVTFPEGESFLQAWKRIDRTLTKLARENPRGTILICTHGDIIKMAVTQFMGAPLNSFQRVVIDPGSLTTLHCQGKQKTVLRINQSLLPSRKNLKSSKQSKSSLKRRRVLGGGSGD